MSRLRPPALLATPLRPVFGSAAETRSAKIWAKRSARASKGCEERLGITHICPKARLGATTGLARRLSPPPHQNPVDGRARPSSAPDASAPVDAEAAWRGSNPSF